MDNPASVGDLVVTFSGEMNGIGGSLIALANVATGVSVIAGSDGLSVDLTTNPTLDYDGDGNLVIVLEHAFPGYSYFLQTNPGLDSENWINVESVTAAGPLVFFTYPSSGVGSKRFFRLLSVPDN